MTVACREYGVLAGIIALLGVPHTLHLQPCSLHFRNPCYPRRVIYVSSASKLPLMKEGHVALSRWIGLSPMTRLFSAALAMLLLIAAPAHGETLTLRDAIDRALRFAP